MGIKNFNPKPFIILQHKEANDRKNNWNNKQTSFYMRELNIFDANYFALSFKLKKIADFLLGINIALPDKMM
jgi:hypothetical protein